MGEDTLQWKGGLEGTQWQNQSKFLPSLLADLGLQGLEQQLPKFLIFWLQTETHTTGFVLPWLRLRPNHPELSLGPMNRGEKESGT